MNSHLETCAWCHKEVRLESKACPVFATTIYKALLEGHEGFIPLPLALANRTVFAAICTDDSDAKKEGWDLILMTCSPDCAKALKAALDRESNIGKTHH